MGGFLLACVSVDSMPLAIGATGLLNLVWTLLSGFGTLRMELCGVTDDFVGAYSAKPRKVCC